MAASLSDSTVNGEFRPEEAEKNAGKYLLLYAKTGTPFVYKYYKVLGISNIDLTPADTTLTGVAPNY